MRLKLSLWSFLSLWVSVSAFGDDGNDSQIETITVSALPIMIDEAGSSVSIINREDILLKNVATLQELLREVPGFSVSQQGSHGAITQVRVRGAEANQVLVLIDGIEMNDISQGSEVDFSNILTHDIERIEIVRGPQSSLWGNDAVAGVIHIITRPQGASDPSLAINAEGGSFGTTRVGATLTHATTRARVKFTATTLSTDGTDISRANISGAGSEDDGYENTTIGLTGSYDISDELRGAVTVRYTDATTEFDDIDFFTTGLPVDADFETDSEYLYAGVRLDHDINESMSQSLSLARTDTDNETTTANPVADITRGVKDALRYQLNMTRDAHRISLLAEHETEDYQQRGAASFFGDPNQNLDADTDSVAIEYRYDGVRFNVSASARFDDNSEFKNSESWRLTGNWQLANDATILFASVGESTKNPTFTERFGYFTNFIGNPDLRVEESFGWEVGVKHAFDQDRLRLGLTYFNADLNDEINGFVFDINTGGFTSANVDGESDRQGVEFELSYQPIAQLNLNATYTYLDANQEDASGRNVTEVRRPENSGSLSASYEWGQAALHIAASYTGKQEDDFFPPYPPYQERVELDSFTLLSLSGFYEINDSLTLTARVENATDKNYEQVFGFESPGVGGYIGLRMQW